MTIWFHEIFTKFRVSGSTTIGQDRNGDMIPDVPLRYEIHKSKSVVQFPLGFCPNAPNGIDFSCQGNFGIVIKEWKTITRVYPESTSNLNRVTKQVDVDVMDNFGNKIPIKNLKSNIEIIIERLQHKDPAAVTIPSKCCKSFSFG